MSPRVPLILTPIIVLQQAPPCQHVVREKGNQTTQLTCWQDEQNDSALAYADKADLAVVSPIVRSMRVVWFNAYALCILTVPKPSPETLDPVSVETAWPIGT